MNSIAEQAMTKDEVVKRSRELLHLAYTSLEEHKEDLAGIIVKGIQEDKIVGTCPKCGKQLKIIRSKKTKKRFVGCDGYPDCDTHLSAAADGQAHPHARGMPAVQHAQGQDHHPRTAAVGALHRPGLPDQG